MRFRKILYEDSTLQADVSRHPMTRRAAVLSVLGAAAAPGSATEVEARKERSPGKKRKRPGNSPRRKKPGNRKGKNRKGKNGPRNDSRRKNVILINFDDISAYDMSVGLPKTYSYFRRTGMISDTYICENPVCGPARVSLMTGKSSDRTGVLTNQMAGRGIKGPTMAKKLRRRGYETFLLGKDLNRSRKESAGWDRYDTASGRKSKRIDGDYITDYYTKQAEDFIKSSKKPFFLYLAPRIPHAPFKSDQKYNRRFRHVTVRDGRPAFNEIDVSDKPLAIRRLPLLDESRMNLIARKRLRMLASADQMIMRLIRSLGKQKKKTLIVIVGDNGYSLGSHRVTTKGQPYDPSLRTLMFARGPGIPRRVTSHRLVAVQDVAVTIGRIVGFQIPKANGQDFRPGMSPDRPHVLIQFYQREGWQGLRGPDWLYVERGQTGEREYYDLTEDPYQLDNLLANWEGHTPQLSPERQAELNQMLMAALSG